MIRISLQDLLYRRRRYLMVIVVAALAFGLALVMTGIVNQMRQEGAHTVALFGADRWVVADGVSGPFTSSQLLPGSTIQEAAKDPTVSDASPILIGRTAIDSLDVNIVGYDPASTMLPAKLKTARASGVDGAIVDVTLHRAVGETLTIGGATVPIVALVTDTGFFFSAPTVFLPIDTVRSLLFASQDVVSAVVVRGQPSTPPAGTILLTNEQVRGDFDRVIASTADTIGIIKTLLWTMAAIAVAAIVYVGVLERTKDLATLKAIGASTRSLLGGLVAQSAVVALLGALAAVGVSELVSPTFSFPVSVPASAFVRLPIMALGVGVLASAAGIRKIAHIDPTIAFGATS